MCDCTQQYCGLGHKGKACTACEQQHASALASRVRLCMNRLQAGSLLRTSTSTANTTDTTRSCVGFAAAPTDTAAACRLPICSDKIHR
jgi:hypothetical protein